MPKPNFTILFIFIIYLFVNSCADGQIENTNKMEKYKYTNSLISETSPYLLQHAHNPVNWHAWSKETLKLAQKENKPIIISIGYSSCHWCHVMEHQSFENEAVAELMNDNFICIKVDREEHPDVDQIYMNAVNLITGSGGWPLNCFALPDGRPFYGGTYYNKEQWTSVLKQLSALYNNDYDKLLQHAESISNGIKQSEIVEKQEGVDGFSNADLDRILNNWTNHLDDENGGPDRSPKFPLPNNYRFLMRYANFNSNQIIDEHIELTLNKMANGGIYDQLGGGFARYSTDKLWKVPHFEKMLYDNAQLVSLYSDAYKRYKDDNYKRIIEETLEYIKREMTNNQGLFYSALDADSDGKEGKYYIWTLEEIDDILGEKSEIFKDYYQMNEVGYWEDDNYILMRNEDIEDLAKKHNISTEEIESNISSAKKVLMNYRENRTKPGLDDKSLLSWNSMMISAYCDAYSALGNDEYMKDAINAMNFILENMKKPEGGFWHTFKNGKSKINAYLDDYALLIKASLSLYEIGAGNKYLLQAKVSSDYIIDKFYDVNSGMFFYTNSDDEILVARKMEIFDNVIPASNSIVARNLYKLSHYFENEDYKDISLQMLNNVIDKFRTNGSSLSNWGLLLMDELQPKTEVVILGNDAKNILKELQSNYFPNIVWAIDTKDNSELELLKYRFVENKTMIYVCVNNSCKLPVQSIDDALRILSN
ncbi:MAG: thioredoxin domain-containing protein [Bacteroidales bacterium]|nr:thioredoxin domain-containing protein [Bacteroidales bacterium]